MRRSPRLTIVLTMAIMIAPAWTGALAANAKVEGLLQRAGELLKRRDGRGALPYAQSAVKLEPDNFKTQFMLGSVLFGMDRKEESIGPFRECLKINPNSKVDDLYINLGEALIIADKPREAMDILTLGIKQAPSGNLYRARGSLYESMDQSTKALDDMNNALLLRRNHDTYLHDRALIYMHIKNYEKALADFTTLVQQKPFEPRNYSERATAYKALGKYSLAAQDVEKGKALLFESGK